MQFILGIDLSCQPCELTLSQVEGTSVEVVSRSTVRLPLFASKELLRAPDLASNTKQESPAEMAANAGPGASQNSPAQDPTSHQYELVNQTVSDLRSAIDSINGDWTAISVILPQHDFLALNLDLPFGDPRNLDRIVDLEVQDVVPFELESFFIQYAPLSSASSAVNGPSGQQFDVHIGILPRVVVRNILNICKRAGLEPNVLTVPSSAIGAAYHLAKDYLKTDSALVFNRGDEYCMAVFINGEVRVERTVYASQLLSAQAADERSEGLQHIFTALKLILASAERRYGTKIEKVYLLGRDVKGANTHQLFGRPLEGLPFKDLFRSDDSQAGISALSAVFAQDDAGSYPLSNFRSREFSFTPRISEFIRALGGTRKAVVRAIGAILVSASVIYGARHYMITSSEKALIQQIQLVVPSFVSEPEMIRPNLMKAEQKLAEELGAFGSRSKVSPADSFIEVVKSIPSSGEIAVNSIRVSGIRVQLVGSAAELAAIERFIKSLNSRQDIFSKVEYKTSRTGSRFNVTVDIALAQ